MMLVQTVILFLLVSDYLGMFSGQDLVLKKWITRMQPGIMMTLFQSMARAY